MTFYEVLEQVLALLQRHRRMTYRALKRQFDLDDTYLEDLKAELIQARHVASDEDGSVLVWTGDTVLPPRPGVPPARDAERPPRVEPPPHLAAKILTSRAALEGERKQVTVLFADIKGSTELIQGLDPEEARHLLDPALHAMMGAVHRYEGTVNQVLGDGIMALFGAPVAHEDHAARACYTALAMQAALRRYDEEVRRTHGLTVQIRVGLNSGEVVVRAIGNDLHMDYSAVGQTTHLAARMEQLATPGTILLTAATLRLVEGLVVVRALGHVPVKGLTDPVDTFELVGATTVRRRLHATATQGLTRFVGRQTEIETLSQALGYADSGHGQVVTVVGEPGVGKSRLFYEFLRSHRTQGWLVLESASVSYGKATPYFPVLDLMKRYCHVEDSDEPRTVRAKVTGQVLTLDAALKDTVPALLALLDVLPADDPFLQSDPSQRRRRTFEALKRVLLRESQVQPLLLVFEDLHWIDTETQALLDSLVESLPTTRVCLLTNYRPEYQHDWSNKTYYTQLRLDPLLPESAEAFLQGLIGESPALEPLLQLLIARTAGNPFFLEESVRTLVETGALVGECGAYRLAQALPTLQVPTTVQAVLAARMDRLPPEAKQVLQTAAVIGTEVPLPLLQAITDLPEAALYDGLRHLQATEFVYETHLFPEHAYTFKHALTHEVAYGSLLQERRRALHARIVEALETLVSDRLADHVDRLAVHALRGELWAKALLYCRQAGDKALARSAHREAVGYFEQALRTLPQLPETRDTREQAIDLRLALRTALLPFGDWGQLLGYLREAEALAEALGDTRRLGQVLVLLALHFRNTGLYAQALAAGERALALATASGDRVRHALAHQYLGQTYHDQGAYAQAMACLAQTVTTLAGAGQRERFGQVNLPAVASRTWLAWCYAELGRFSEGEAVGAAGLQLAEEVAHPGSLLYACWGLGVLALRQGALHRALPLLERAMGLCQEMAPGARQPTNFLRLAGDLGAAYTLAGRLADAVPLLTRAVAAQDTPAAGEAAGVMHCRLFLGEAQRRAGHLAEAHTLAVQALTLARTHQRHGLQAYALRLLGEIATQREPLERDEAEEYYSQARARAEALGMRPLLAHCHARLGTLYVQTHDWEQARVALAAALAMYQAMGMTFWLPCTEAALAQISPGTAERRKKLQDHDIRHV